MPQTSVAAEPRVACRFHRFDGRTPGLVGKVELCMAGHDHGEKRLLYSCTRLGCGFVITTPVGYWY